MFYGMSKCVDILSIKQLLIDWLIDCKCSCVSANVSYAKKEHFYTETVERPTD